jgi:hypothetical protein
MAGNGRLACVSFAAGVITGGALACAAFLFVGHYGGGMHREPHLAISPWITALLSSSVAGSILAAVFNARGVRLGRSESLGDSAFAACEGFATAARQYLDEVGQLIAGRAAIAPLALAYGVARTRLIRLTGSAGRQSELLDEVYECLVGVPQDATAHGGIASREIGKAQERLRALESALGDLGGSRRPHVRRLTSGGKTA